MAKHTHDKRIDNRNKKWEIFEKFVAFFFLSILRKFLFEQFLESGLEFNTLKTIDKWRTGVEPQNVIILCSRRFYLFDGSIYFFFFLFKIIIVLVYEWHGGNNNNVTNSNLYEKCLIKNLAKMKKKPCAGQRVSQKYSSVKIIPRAIYKDKIFYWQCWGKFLAKHSSNKMIIRCIINLTVSYVRVRMILNLSKFELYNNRAIWYSFGFEMNHKFNTNLMQNIIHFWDWKVWLTFIIQFCSESIPPFSLAHIFVVYISLLILIDLFFEFEWFDLNYETFSLQRSLYHEG